MCNLTDHGGETRYKVLVLPPGGLSGEALQRTLQVMSRQMDSFRLSGQSENRETIELTCYEGAQRLARLQIGREGLGIETDCNEKVSVPHLRWHDWLGQFGKAADAAELQPANMAVIALVYSFYFRTPRGNCYEWLLSKLAAESKLRQMLGDSEVVDFQITLQARSEQGIGARLYLELDSNLTEREIVAGDYSDERNRGIVRCHHAITDIKATSEFSGETCFSSVLARQEQLLSNWIVQDVLPIMATLVPAP